MDETEVRGNADKDMITRGIRDSVSRREFLKMAGLAGAAVTLGGGLTGVLVGCGETETTTTTAAATTTTAAATTTTAAATSTTAAGSTTSVSTSAEAKVLKLGGLHPLTGANAGWGIPCTKGCQLAVEQINANGGQLEVGAGKDPNGGPGFIAKNGQRYKLEYVEFDGRFDPKTEVEGALKMKSDGVRVILGYRNGMAAVNEVTEPAKIFQMCPGVPSDATPAGIKYVYADNWSAVCGTLWPQMVGPSGQTDGVVLTGCDSVAIITENAAACVPVRDMFIKAVEAKGIKVPFDETVESDVSELRSLISKMKPLKPDLVFVNTLGLNVAQYYPQAKELGLRPTATISQDAVGTRPPDARKTIGNGYVGNIEPFWMVPMDQQIDEELAKHFGFVAEKREKFMADFTAKFGTEYLSGGALHEFDLAHAFCSYMSAAESPEDQDSIAAVFNAGTKYEGAWISVWYSVENHRLNYPIGIGCCTALDEATGAIKLDFIGVGKAADYQASSWNITVRKQIDLKKPWSEYFQV